METISSRNDSLSDYADYSAFLREHRDRKDFGWLYEFLGRPDPVPGNTRVVVGESLNKSIKLNHCNDAGRIQNFLQESDSNIDGGIKVRIVLLCYTESWSFDRTVLKAVAEKYAIPPTFLWSHFCHEMNWCERDGPYDVQSLDLDGEIQTPFLPSERQAWIELKTGFTEECLSALIFNHLKIGETTIVVFIRTKKFRSGSFRVSSMSTEFPKLVSFSKPSGNYSPTTATYYEALLRNLSPEAIEAANANPIEYIFPYARLLALQISSLMKFLGDQIQAEEIDAGIMEKMSAIWKELKDLREGLNVSISSLRRHSSPSSTHSELLRDYEELLNDVKQREIDFKDVLNHKVSLLALKESMGSIRQAEIVRRLSQLAFVFIPLTFVTSCFGMNLTVLGSGNGKMWVFCVISVTLTVTILLISVYSWRVAHSRFLEENTRPVRALFRLAKYLPAETMWMILFMISKPSKIDAFLLRTGLYHHLLANGKYDHRDFPVYDSASYLGLDEFWKIKHERIYGFFNTAGWRRNTFLRRLMRL